uniref:Uncharacterized protein n=1 Tax=Rhizophora mucronata TaxID=61149 RepID=A0A2P2IHQ9_RHIMU
MKGISVTNSTIEFSKLFKMHANFCFVAGET